MNKNIFIKYILNFVLIIRLGRRLVNITGLALGTALGLGIGFSISLFSCTAFSQTNVFRKSSVSTEKYLQALKINKRRSFINFYLELQNSLDKQETLNLDSLLEKIYTQPREAKDLLDKAFVLINQQFLNSERRDLWFSLLLKKRALLEQVADTGEGAGVVKTAGKLGVTGPGVGEEKEILEKTIANILEVSSELKKNFEVELEDFKLEKHNKESLRNSLLSKEIKAFLISLSENEDFKDSMIFIDGEKLEPALFSRIKNTDHHWVFLTNVYQPYIFYGSWTDFTKQYSKNLIPFLKGTCDSSPQWDNIPLIWALEGEFFYGDDCILTEKKIFLKNEEEQEKKALLEKQQSISSLMANNKYLWLAPLTLFGFFIIKDTYKDKTLIISREF